MPKAKKNIIAELRAEEAAQFDEPIGSTLQSQVDELYELRTKMVSLGVDSISKLDVMIGRLNAEIIK